MTQLARNNKVTIEFDAQDVGPMQTRLLKTLASTLLTLSKTENESEYFENSAELLRITASIIKESKFASDHSKTNKIPYGDQAVEYALDTLQEYVSNAKIICYDN